MVLLQGMKSYLLSANQTWFVQSDLFHIFPPWRNKLSSKMASQHYADASHPTNIGLRTQNTFLETHLKTWSGTTLVEFDEDEADATALPAASSGAFAEFKTCIMLGSLKWEISTIIPSRFISLRTIWGERRTRKKWILCKFTVLFPL